MKNQRERRFLMIARRDPALFGCILACGASLAGIVLTYWLTGVF